MFASGMVRRRRAHAVRWAAAALLCLGSWGVASASGGDSSATLNFSSYGYIGNGGSFAGIGFSGTSGQAADPGALLLGSFTNTNSSLPVGSEITFKDVPFTINLTVTTPYDAPDWASQTFTIQGLLNGSLTGPNRSSLLASVTSMTEASYYNARLLDPTGVSFLPQAIGWAGQGGTSYSAMAGYLAPGSIQYGAVPEPTSALIFGAAGVAGLVIRGRLRSKAKAA
ncbi:MAG: hypothetical protein U0800_19670 [Isosphaeraceae bacterium]